MEFPGIANEAYRQIACISGQLFRIYRPNLSVIDQTPVLVGQSMLNVTPGGSRYAIPQLLGIGIEYYTVIGDRSQFQPGDILIPAGANTSIPPVTVLNMDDGLPCVAFRTSRLCSINYTTAVGDNVYTNVRFDYCSYTTPQSGLIDQLSMALSVSNKKIVLWTRSNLQPQNQVKGAMINGMKIVETDGTVPIRYSIRALTQVGNLTVFSVNDPED